MNMVQLTRQPDFGSPAPSVDQWHRLWGLWDTATLDMIPRGRHCDRPLELRQPFVFYLGHLPAFTDARLAKVLQQQLTEPAHFAEMFARGIDPDLDNPSQCHAHSPTPAQWPTIDDILAYRDAVRTRIVQRYSITTTTSSSSSQADSIRSHPTGTATTITEAGASAALPGTSCTSSSCCIGAAAANNAGCDGDDADVIAAMPAVLQHVLWMAYEHEAMHLETLLYLLVQYESVRPPPSHLIGQTPTELWCSSAAAASAGIKDNAVSYSSQPPLDLHLLPLPPTAAWVHVPPAQLTVGFTPQHSTQHKQNPSTANIHEGRPLQEHSCSSSSSGPLRFAWDNECPAREASTEGVYMQHRPVTVLEYLHFVACQLANSFAGRGGGDSGPGSSAAAGQHSCIAAEVQQCAGQDGSCQDYSYSSRGSSAGGDAICSKEELFTTSSSSSTLPEARAGCQAQHHPLCCSCRQSLMQLLQHNPAAEGLLPGSLTLLPAQPPAAAGGADGLPVETANCSAASGTTHSTASAYGCYSGSAGSSSCLSLCSMLQAQQNCQDNFLCHSRNSCSTQHICSARRACASSKPQTDQAHHSDGAADGEQEPSTQSALVAAIFNSLQLAVGVKTVFGPVTMSIAGHWPVYCSALQAEQYAAWCAGPDGQCRLPTEAEILAAQHHNQLSQFGDTPQLCRGRQSVGPGVEGVDFAAWHPLCVPLHAADALHGVASSQESCSMLRSSGSVTHSASTPVSQLSGNGWEWTCSPFSRHEGFEAHELYPEYSQDFFGGKHVVLLGGSWATIDSIATRATFRNWYQKGQQHVFAKFRLCKSATS